jgi:hypothetical protein
MRFMLAVCVLILGFEAKLVACDCKPPPAPKKALEFSAAVFLAEAIKVEDAGQERTVTLKVEHWWKGGEAAEITVRTSKSGASCGYGFEKGKKYLVYAHAEPKQKTLHVSLCSRTRTVKEAETDGDFKELGEGKAPEGLIPVRVTAAVKASPKEGAEIPLAVTIHNGLKGDIRHTTFALEPKAWNGETLNVALVDVYRDGEKIGLFRAAPVIKTPLELSGTVSQRIEAGKTLTIHTEARKWNIAGGWKPGKYSVIVRVENLAVDGDRVRLSVQSDFFEFEIK